MSNASPNLRIPLLLEGSKAPVKVEACLFISIDRLIVNHGGAFVPVERHPEVNDSWRLSETPINDDEQARLDKEQAKLKKAKAAT